MMPLDTDDNLLMSNYRPVSLDIKSTSRCVSTSVWSPGGSRGAGGMCNGADNDDIPKGDVFNSIVDATIHSNSNVNNCHALFYPQGISMIMRLVRILSMNNGASVTGISWFY